MNVYDFDKTIFYPDSSVKFFFHCLKRHPLAVLRTVPALAVGAVRYAAGSLDTKGLKERIFAFLRFLPDAQDEVEDFWQQNFRRVGGWYLERRRPDDLIISASPEFLLRPAADRLGVRLIATSMDIKTGRIDGANCHDMEKLRRFETEYGDAAVDEFYSDSLSDTPMAERAERAYLVSRGALKPWRDGKGKGA